jgi:hypothetical protein
VVGKVESFLLMSAIKEELEIQRTKFGRINLNAINREFCRFVRSFRYSTEVRYEPTKFANISLKLGKFDGHSTNVFFPPRR